MRMMLAIAYILGQLNTPINRLIIFMHNTQDAKLSLDRLSEIHEYKNEDEVEHTLHLIPDNKGIYIKDLSFRYEGPHSSMVLQNLDLVKPPGYQMFVTMIAM